MNTRSCIVSTLRKKAGCSGARGVNGAPWIIRTPYGCALWRQSERWVRWILCCLQFGASAARHGFVLQTIERGASSALLAVKMTTAAVRLLLMAGITSNLGASGKRNQENISGIRRSVTLQFLICRNLVEMVSSRSTSGAKAVPLSRAQPRAICNGVMVRTLEEASDLHLHSDNTALPSELRQWRMAYGKFSNLA